MYLFDKPAPPPREKLVKTCLHPLCLFVKICCVAPTQLKTMESEEVIDL